jgi:hypothetical protein
VVVVAGAVVDVTGAVVDVTGAVVAVTGAVVAVAGAVVAVAGAVVDGTVGPLLAAVIRFVMACDGGLGIVVPAGTNAMVINWPLVNRRLWGSPGVCEPDFDVKLGHW